MSAVMNEQARLRHYLEQMMVAFLMSDIPVAEAADQLAEIESHCIEAGTNAPADPFELFGDPMDLALQILPAPTLGEHLRQASWVAVFSLANVALASLVLRFAGVQSVSRLEACAAIAVVGGFSALSLLLTRPVPRDQRAVGRGPIMLAGLIVGVATSLACAALWVTYSDDVVPLHLGLWLLLAAIVVPASIAILSRMNRHRGPLVAPQPIGITADIVHDMETKGAWEGWIQYGMDGEELAPLSLRDGAESIFDKAKSAYSKIRSALDG